MPIQDQPDHNSCDPASHGNLGKESKPFAAIGNSLFACLDPSGVDRAYGRFPIFDFHRMIGKIAEHLDSTDRIGSGCHQAILWRESLRDIWPPSQAVFCEIREQILQQLRVCIYQSKSTYCLVLFQLRTMIRKIGNHALKSNRLKNCAADTGLCILSNNICDENAIRPFLPRIRCNEAANSLFNDSVQGRITQ